MFEDFMDYFKRQIDFVDALCCAPDEIARLTGRENITP